jgi:hypothetical protein
MAYVSFRARRFRTPKRARRVWPVPADTALTVYRDDVADRADLYKEVFASVMPHKTHV